MKLGELAVAGVLGVLACAGLIWTGIGFAGFALATALAPSLGSAGAAALTALVLLIVPLLVVLLFGRRRAGPAVTDREDNLLFLIAQVAKERPIMAVLGAALFGAAEVLLNNRKRKK